MAYIELDLMKLILGIDGTALDELIQFYMDSATEVVKNFIGRDIEESTFVQKLKANDSNTLWLEYKPVSAITAITLNDVDILADVDIVEEDRAIYYSEGFKKGFDYITQQSPYDEGYYTRKDSTINVEINGTFGYATIPTDIQNVVSNIVQNNYVKSGISPQVKKESCETDFGKSQKEYFNIINSVDLSDEDKETLIKYR